MVGGAAMKERARDVLLEAAAILVGALAAGVTCWSFGTDPMWAVMAFVLLYDSDKGLVLKAAARRLGLTVFGSVLAMAVIFACGVHKWTLPAALVIGVLVCGVFLPARASWRIVLVTVTLIVGSAILQASLGPYIAVTRSLEVFLGGVLAVGLSLAVARVKGKTEGP